MLEELDKGHLILELKGNWWKLSDISFCSVCSTLRTSVVRVGDGAPHLDHGAGQTLTDHVVTCNEAQHQSRLQQGSLSEIQELLLDFKNKIQLVKTFFRFLTNYRGGCFYRLLPCSGWRKSLCISGFSFRIFWTCICL